MPVGTGTPGRDIVVKWDGVVIAGVREKSLAINGEKINVSDDQSSGLRVLLEAEGERSIDISCAGVVKSDVLRKAKATGVGTVKPLEYIYPDGAKIAGDFALGSGYTEGAPYQDGTTFEAQFQSTGAWTYTPSPG